MKKHHENNNREKKLSEDKKNPYADFNIRHVTLDFCDPTDIHKKLAEKVVNKE